MFERLTVQSRRALITARMMATEAGRTVIEPGDVVLGVVFQDSTNTIAPGEKAALLAALGTIEAPSPTTEPAPVPFSGGTLEALAASGRIADTYAHKWIRPEHLLAGVAHDPSSAAAQAISLSGIDLDGLIRGAVAAVPDGQIDALAPAGRIH